jgi:hypothetical protein
MVNRLRAEIARSAPPAASTETSPSDEKPAPVAPAPDVDALIEAARARLARARFDHAAALQAVENEHTKREAAFGGID